MNRPTNSSLARLARAACGYGVLQDRVERHAGLFVELRDEAGEELKGAALEYFAAVTEPDAETPPESPTVAEQNMELLDEIERAAVHPPGCVVFASSEPVATFSAPVIPAPLSAR